MLFGSAVKISQLALKPLAFAFPAAVLRVFSARAVRSAYRAEPGILQPQAG